jgi:hypothetical protein
MEPARKKAGRRIPCWETLGRLDFDSHHRSRMINACILMTGLFVEEVSI